MKTLETSESNAFRTIGILAIFQLLIIGVLACMPHPTPPNPVPVVDDTFSSAVIDCSIDFDNPPVNAVYRCFDISDAGVLDPDPCLGELTKTNTKDAVGCTVRDYGMLLHVALANGSSTLKDKARAAAIDRWFRNHQIGVRN